MFIEDSTSLCFREESIEVVVFTGGIDLLFTSDIEDAPRFRLKPSYDAACSRRKSIQSMRFIM